MFQDISFLLAGAFGTPIPWSVIIFLIIVAVGLLLIRTAITLVKVALIVGAGVAIFLLVQFVFNFG